MYIQACICSTVFTSGLKLFLKILEKTL
uniref:Uncharacterized protein n=1 Tax=Anguilla anguilla TaxID=7936 RepID=A0A0E9TZA1_ANGAN